MKSVEVECCRSPPLSSLKLINATVSTVNATASNANATVVSRLSATPPHLPQYGKDWVFYRYDVAIILISSYNTKDYQNTLLHP
jgi:hypothetical protein